MDVLPIPSVRRLPELGHIPALTHTFQAGNPFGMAALPNVELWVKEELLVFTDVSQISKTVPSTWKAIQDTLKN